MSDHDNELTGPDFTLGVEAGSVRPGQLVAGHAFGEPVLLAHVEPNWFAVGAKCTHYSAPLVDGLLVGETIRCPWHHACFELRNGAATCGPALNDLQSFVVSVENNVVRVTGRKDTGPLRGEVHRPRGSRAPEKALFDEHPVFGPSSVVIIGASAAGVGCAEMLRREGYRGPVTMIDADPDAPYDRPNLSKDYLAGNAPAEWLPLHPPEFYAAQHIEIRAGVEAKAIDTSAKTVRLSDGSSLKFGALLLATGASPIRLSIPGGDRILYLRTLRDCRNIIDAAGKSKRAVVIGASFIGLEVAASLRARGLEVHVVAPETLPLERVLGTGLGELISSVHKEQGVIFHLGRSVVSLDADAVLLDDATRISCDLVVAGVGVRPNLALAQSAGLAVDNGVSVNEFLETSVSGVFAAGDIARWPDAYSESRIRVEHWVVALRQGQTAARNILGNRDRFDDIPFFWSAHYDKLSIQYTGHVDRWDETRVEGDLARMDCAVSYIVNGQRRAVATINRDRQNLETELAMQKELLLQAPTSINLQTAEV
jgi:3-phenylpropionate/trans-cinnamate dioxygenase ferredoxin reductase subunit